MRKAFLILVILFSACASSNPSTVNLTPAGQTAYTADQIVIRVNELENAAIQANASNALDTNTTRIIVTWCVNADTTLASLPSGYMATITAAWNSAKMQIKTTNVAIVAAMAGVDTVLGVVQ